jgi:hypothetical protein
LSFCGLYRVLDVPGKFSIKTIVEPGVSISSSIHEEAKEFGSTLLKWEKRLPWKPSPMLSSGPASAETMKSIKKLLGRENSMNSQSRTGSYAVSILRSPSLTSAMITLSSLLRLKSQLSNLLDIGKEILKYNCDIETVPLGRLSTKEEPNKVRVFAIVDSITQWLLQPLHRHLFNILRRQFSGVDATFDQESGVELARKKISLKEDKTVYSFDLSAATDRLPLSIQIEILNGLKEGLGTA